MGFDLYGMSPQINKKYPHRYKKIMKKYGKDGWLDWSQDIPDTIKEEYFELKEQYEKNNPGDYFRNNVWWWRPLWNLVCVSCDDILTEKDISGGSYNNGHKISKTKATRIGKRLSKLIADGTVDKLNAKEGLARAKAKAYNEDIQEQLDELKKEVQKVTHNNSLAPCDYTETYYSKWDKLYSKKKWEADYPFDGENVKEFAKFCIQ